MSTVTEIAYIPLQEALDIESPTSDAGKAYARMLALLREAKGSQRVFWSRQVEHENVLEILIDWDDYNSFEAFPKTAAFQEFLALLPHIAAGAPSIKNVRIRDGPGIQKLAASPVLEMTTTFLPLDVDMAVYEKIVDAFLPVLAQNTPGFLGSTSGWVIEEQDSPVDGSSDSKAKAFVICLAWESIEAHVAGTKIAANKEAIAPWKAAIIHAEMHHVKLTNAI